MPELILGPALRHVGRRTATVWVETDGPCTVEVLGSRADTFAVAGHHYALVIVEGLEPGTGNPYRVHLDGRQVWPAPDTRLPPSRIRTLNGTGPVRIAFGSCRYANGHVGEKFGVDALDALAFRTAAAAPDEWPDLLLMLGDQVYADETTPATRARIAGRRRLDLPPGGEVADYEEYTWLYEESWRDPEVRWLMSTVPCAMIFDDHDVHDDWNSSREWRRDVQRTSWWPERIVGALSSYWVYQHLGNLSPEELAEDPVWAAVRAAAADGRDAEPELRALAVRADAEADGGKGYRWSFWRNLGDVRLVVLDSRCGRMLDGQWRSMLSEAEFRWVADRLDGAYDHLLIGTSVPWLMPPAVHAIEAWDERLAEDHPGTRRARWGERFRLAADLEHWPAFHASFERLGGLIVDVADGRRGDRTPATISVLSGDVHHSYVCVADLSGWESAPARPGTPRSRVFQLTCSPVHNAVPGFMRTAFTLAWSRGAERVTRLLLGRLARIPNPPVSWHRTAGPVFGNAIAQLTLDGRAARVVFDSPNGTDAEESLRRVLTEELSGPTD